MDSEEEGERKGSGSDVPEYMEYDLLWFVVYLKNEPHNVELRRVCARAKNYFGIGSKTDRGLRTRVG